MSQPTEERSYDELLALCTKLEAESGHHLVMQQDLVRAKNRVDIELMRFKAIQNYIAKVLDATAPEEFCNLTLEAVIEAFEVEVALFLEISAGKKTECQRPVRLRRGTRGVAVFRRLAGWQRKRGVCRG